jgi:hypothetical protein
MKFALFNEERIEAKKGAKGECPCCGSELIAKCGEVYIHHWAHKKKCDDHWWENETEWHRNWKNQFPNEWQEIVHFDDSGEKHIADVKTSEGWAIEFQHSYLKPEERRSRNNFYNKLIWVVDGMRRKTDVKQFQKILNKADFVFHEPVLLDVNYPEDCKLLKEWGNSSSLIFVDFDDSLIGYRDGYGSTEDLWLIYPQTSDSKVFISQFARSSFIELLNNNKCDEIFDKLINPIQKEIKEYIINEKAARKKFLKSLKEKDEEIRKKYGIKDDEDYFDGRYKIHIFKRSDFNKN